MKRDGRLVSERGMKREMKAKPGKILCASLTRNEHTRANISESGESARSMDSGGGHGLDLGTHEREDEVLDILVAEELEGSREHCLHHLDV